MTQALEEALLQHFTYRKLEISYAIRKPFPFFEGLRDKSFITERTYRVSHVGRFSMAAQPSPGMPDY